MSEKELNGIFLKYFKGRYRLMVIYFLGKLLEKDFFIIRNLNKVFMYFFINGKKLDLF